MRAGVIKTGAVALMAALALATVTACAADDPKAGASQSSGQAKQSDQAQPAGAQQTGLEGQWKLVFLPFGAEDLLILQIQKKQADFTGEAVDAQEFFGDATIEKIEQDGKNVRMTIESDMGESQFAGQQVSEGEDAGKVLGTFRIGERVFAARLDLDEIYPRIKQRNAEIKFYVVGSGVPDWLRSIATADPSIVLTGYVDDPLSYIQRAAVFVAPILSGGGTKLKVLEAMAVGKAIVSTSIGVEGIEGKDQEHFLMADSPEAFSSGVVSLLNDRVFRERLGANARRRAMEKYDWEAICEAISRIYQGARQKKRDAI